MTDLLRKQQQSLNSSLSSFFPTPKSRGSREQLTPHNTGSAPAPTQKYSISNDSLFNEKDFPKKPDTKNNKQHGSSSAIQSFSAPPNVAAATTITTTDNGDSWTTSGMSQAKADAVQAYLQSLPKDNSNNHNSSPADPKLLEEKLSMAAAAEPDLYSNNAVAATLNSKRTTRQHERYLRFDEVVKKNLKVKLSKNCIDLKRYPVVEGLSKELKLVESSRVEHQNKLLLLRLSNPYSELTNSELMILNGLLPKPKNRPHYSSVKKRDPIEYDQWAPKKYSMSEEQEAYFSRLATPARKYKPPVANEPISPKIFAELPPEKVEYYNRLATRRVFKEPYPPAVVKKLASEFVISEEKQRYYASLAQPLRVAERADKKKKQRPEKWIPKSSALSPEKEAYYKRLASPKPKEDASKKNAKKSAPPPALISAKQKKNDLVASIKASMRASTDGKQPKDQIEGKNELEEAAATAALRTVDETEAPEPANSENMIELTAEAVMENEAVAGTSDETTVISKTVSQVPTEKSAIIVASSTTAKKEEESNTVSLTEKPQPVERTTLDEELTFAEQYS